MRTLYVVIFLTSLFCLNSCDSSKEDQRTFFGESWKFFLGDTANAELSSFDDSNWRLLNLPHDWSIEGDFSEDHPATQGGGALPGGIGWYRKSFRMNPDDSSKLVFIEFDGVYMNSKVWINGHLLGERPNGYISFCHELTPHLNYGEELNVLAVRVDNSKQPNSRWYSGSGIYRNVWMVRKSKIHFSQWGTFITTPEITQERALVNIRTELTNTGMETEEISLAAYLVDKEGRKIGSLAIDTLIMGGGDLQLERGISVSSPELWSIESPVLYKAELEVRRGSKLMDQVSVPFGIRFFEFDAEKGFSLNGKPIKIKGVCNHHDLGCLGSAVSRRALERQLEILKGMGCNAIRTSHNPPAPELLDLCDEMGFIVMDEAFDMWKKSKTEFDYGLYWDDWHERDLIDFMKRDRNHPSVIIWSIGNEILEQWDTSGIQMVKDLYTLARLVDTTRPITTANNPPGPGNNLNKPMVLDLIGFNYAHKAYESFPDSFPGQKFIATETSSALATRGHYDMPSDSIRRWPKRWDIPFNEGNPDNTVSAYDHVSAPWGSTHEETWKIVKKHDYLSGIFIWTGFDYLGEPTPYGWPSRSSYFGVIDLAGFPKDSYYMYKSEWTDEPVLHIFPHLNWDEGDTVDVWAYFNCERVELFLNGESQRVKEKTGEKFHVMWRLPYEPGILKAVGTTGGKVVLTKEIYTAREPARIKALADRSEIAADGKDLSFISVEILDSAGNRVPYADNLVNFKLRGDARIAGVDNGSQTSHEPFKADYRKAFNGKCLAIVQAGQTKGPVELLVSSEGLEAAKVKLELK